MKQIIIIFICFVITSSSFAQDWSGTTPGDIFYDQGRVGIGRTPDTNFPYAQLEIQKNTNGITTPTTLVRIIGKMSQSNDSQPLLTFATQMASNNPINMGAVGAYHEGNSEGGLQFLTRSNGSINTVMYIDKSGFLGLGTTPVTKLDIEMPLSSSTQPETVARIVGKRSDGNYSRPMLTFGTKHGTNNSIELGSIGAIYEGNSDGGLQFLTKGNSQMNVVMTMNKSGFVGIGTESPGNELEVNGTIRSKEVWVEQGNWPDFVFEKDYQLMPLDELRAFINKKGHLPKVKSANEAHKDGIELAETNRVLLEKIEELTLYILELDDKNNELLNRIEKLEKQ